MADNQFQLILQAAELIEEQRSGENVSEEDTGQIFTLMWYYSTNHGAGVH